MGVVEEALTQIRKAASVFGAGLALSFNGGKDCTAVLHLVHEALGLEGLRRVKIIFWSRPDDFDEVSAFLSAITDRFQLRVICMDGAFKGGLARLVQDSQVRAVLMGTRRGDPFSDSLDPCCFSDDGVCRANPTDPSPLSILWRFVCRPEYSYHGFFLKGWPDFMRINPVLNWTYDEVWHYLREEGKDRIFCSLYKDGFASLGGTRDTFRHPALLNDDGSYRPAWELPKGENERLGREKS